MEPSRNISWVDVKLDSLPDLVASKMVALIERGAPRDFRDIHAVCRAELLTGGRCVSPLDLSILSFSPRLAQLTGLTIPGTSLGLHLRRSESGARVDFYVRGACSSSLPCCVSRITPPTAWTKTGGPVFDKRALLFSMTKTPLSSPSSHNVLTFV